LDLADPGETDAFDRRGRSLEDRYIGTDVDADPDRVGGLRQKRDFLDLADRNALELDRRANRDSADRLAEEDVELALFVAGEFGEEQDEGEQRDGQRDDDAADKDIVTPGFHVSSRPLPPRCPPY